MTREPCEVSDARNRNLYSRNDFAMKSPSLLEPFLATVVFVLMVAILVPIFS